MEKRAYKRFALTGDVVLGLGGDGTCDVSARLLDISAQGLRVEVSVPFEIGTRVTIGVKQGEGIPEAAALGEGEVLSLIAGKRAKAGLYEAGIRYIKPDEKKILRIIQMIQNKLAMGARMRAMPLGTRSSARRDWL